MFQHFCTFIWFKSSQINFESSSQYCWHSCQLLEGKAEAKVSRPNLRLIVGNVELVFLFIMKIFSIFYFHWVCDQDLSDTSPKSMTKSFVLRRHSPMCAVGHLLIHSLTDPINQSLTHWVCFKEKYKKWIMSFAILNLRFRTVKKKKLISFGNSGVLRQLFKHFYRSS